MWSVLRLIGVVRHSGRFRWRALLPTGSVGEEAERQQQQHHCAEIMSAEQIVTICHGQRFRDEFTFNEPAF